MNRNELFDWIGHSILLGQSYLKEAPKLVERNHLKPEELERIKRELELDKRILQAERSDSISDLTEIEQVWRWWLYCYAILHHELWYANSEECSALVHLMRAVRDAEIKHRKTVRLAHFQKLRDDTRERAQTENLGLLMNFIQQHGETKAYNRLKKEGWAKDKAKTHIAYVTALLRTGMEAKRQLEQLEQV